MKIVRFRVVEPDLVNDTNEIHLGYASEDTIFCACGCHGTFELEECEVLDAYEPSEHDLAMMMGWPWYQGEDDEEWGDSVDECGYDPFIGAYTEDC